MDVHAYMSRVPEIDRFLTVDALNAAIEGLAARRPDIARIRRVGTSRLGEPMQMLSIGTGHRNAFLFAVPIRTSRSARCWSTTCRGCCARTRRCATASTTLGT